MGRMNRCRSVTNAATEAHRDVLAVRELFSAPVYDTPFVIASSGPDGDMRVDTLLALYAELPVLEHENQPVRKYGSGILYVDATSADLNGKLFLSSLTPDIRGALLRPARAPLGTVRGGSVPFDTVRCGDSGYRGPG